MTYEQVQQYAWWDWIRFLGPVVIVMINTVISFLDKTMSELTVEDDATKLLAKGDINGL